MGKNNKKTRWRTFPINSKEDDSQNVKLNDFETQLNSSETTTHKYSQVLGDHHSNYISPISNRNSSNHNSKTRNSYNNKENYYNQRSAAKNNTLSSKLALQRSKYASTLKDNRKLNGEIGTDETKESSTTTTEPIKFNEDEYTRITTPRQDVLFKKGYLSRMNSNNNSSTTTNNNKTVSPPLISTTDSTAPNSTATTTNSDQESNVSVSSTLSPATTPSMDYGQQVDGMEYTAPVYYPGYYYDENGILVIPMYNGYNYGYNGSSSTSPVYLMPYPYHQFDPFFMAPNTEVPVPSDKPNSTEQEEATESNESNEKSESKEENGARMSSEDATSNSSNQREDTENIEKEAKQEPHETVLGEQLAKQALPFYPNDYGYMYPTYSNGFYNGIYYYPNGMASNRPPKFKRRKRFMSSRNSHPSRSTETTTDYSDEDNGNSTYVYKRYNPRHHNGWMYHNHHHNNYNYNQYHYNSKYNSHKIDRNANETSSNLNVDVPEFYPCVPIKSDNEASKVIECNDQNETDVPFKTSKDLQNANVPKVKPELPVNKNSKTSHASKTLNSRVSKKEIIEGIKLMEQQNINLISTSKCQLSNVKHDDDWNVIKNGKKIKVSRDTETGVAKDDVEEHAKTVVEGTVKKVSEESVVIKQQENKTASPEKSKKTAASTNAKVNKKSKGKNKKKKNHFTGKQDGFEIIEPDFGNNSDVKAEEVITDDETYADESTSNEIFSEDTTTINKNSTVECGTTTDETVNIDKTVNECVVSAMDILEPVKEEDEVILLKEVLNVEVALKVVESKPDPDDAVIDISDEDICNNSSIEIDLSIAQEIVDEIEKQVIITEEVDGKEFAANEPEIFDELSFFENHKNIAELERDLMENLKVLDDGIDIKSPIINPLYDFPITSAVQKWLTEKQNESFESLFRLENFKKLSELYDDCENDDDDKSDISDAPNKSETTDSDYASDIQVKINGSPASSNAKIDTKLSSKCNNKIIVKESFCALM